MKIHHSIESDDIASQVDTNPTLPDRQYTPNSGKSYANLNPVNPALVNDVISDLQNDIIRGDDHKERRDFMKGAFSESNSEPQTVPYDGIKTNPILSSSSVKAELQSLGRMNANPLHSNGDALKQWKERGHLYGVIGFHIGGPIQFPLVDFF